MRSLIKKSEFIEPIGKEYLEQTIIEFRKNMQGVFEIIAYGEGKKDE